MVLRMAETPTTQPAGAGEAERAIRTVSLFGNGMVAVWDASGQQIPAYQGEWSEKRDLILANLPPTARIEHW